MFASVAEGVWSVEDDRLLAAEQLRTWARDADVTVDPAGFSEAELIDVMVECEQQVARVQARQARAIAEFTRRRQGEPGGRFAADEVGLALRLSGWAASARVGQSAELVERLPETLALWEAGDLDEPRVRAICDATRHLAVETARAVQDRVLPRAPGQTLGQLKAALRRAVLAADPDGAAERRVAVDPQPEGMASLWALLSAPDALSCHQWLTRLARGLGADDPRSMDARRADLLVGLLTGRMTSRNTDTGEGARTLPAPVNPGKPLVQVLVPFHALIGGDQPAELVGYGPITAGQAREIAADATLTRLVFDPLTGYLLDHGRTTYRPPAALADHVRARDVYCRRPGCRRRVLDGELDHIVPYPDGPTSEKNLAGYCVHGHHAKHAPGWKVTALPDGRLEWTTPTGHRYTSEPFDHRLDDDPLDPQLHWPQPERSPPVTSSPAPTLPDDPPF